MTPADRLEALEVRYLAARDARDRLDVARSTGEPADPGTLEALAAEADRLSGEVHEALAGVSPTDAAALAEDDRRALEAMRIGIAQAEFTRLPVASMPPPGACEDPRAWRGLIATGGEALRTRLEACFAAAAEALPVAGGTMTRLAVLSRLGTERDEGRRQTLFLALRPLWTVVDGDTEDASPYRRLIADVAPAWRAGAGSVTANALGLGVRRDEVEAWLLTALAAWRAAVVEPARAAGEPDMEPWDWWWRAGAAQRMLAPLPLETCLQINRAVHEALGADLDRLGVRLDVTMRPGRPPVPIAFTTFGARPRRCPDGTWDPGEPLVIASLRDGGFSELGELVHETGHAIHIAGIRTRPAFADWPDADSLTEALADLVTYDLAEPAWQRRWLPGGIEMPEALSMRAQYAQVVLDAAWALFELRLLANPARRPNDVWTELTSTWLGIAPHPEWSWWAMRGQLVQEPGYMLNYPLGAVLTTALRAGLRGARGDWTGGDPDWYPWVRDHVYRFGRERSSGDVVRSVIGDELTADALLSEIARAGSSR